MAYVLGFFAADGYITVNRRGGQFWCISITDEGLVEEIKKTIESEHKISFRKGRGKNKDQWRMQIGSIEMCNDLRRLGFNERKTKSLAISHVPTKYFSNFVRGYFDGDGNVWIGDMKKDRKHSIFSIMTMFTSGSDKFLRTLQIELAGFGMLGGCIYKSKRNYSRLQYSVNNSLRLYDFMYNTLGTSKLFLKRKKDVFERYKEMRS
ncbi:MAG TPA: LAGLIDADG family homing endonuclease [Candidatus Paceibacterota bacterium]